MSRLLVTSACVLLSLTMPALAESRTAIFSMYCYWTGEATLGQDPGVLESRIGHMGGSEIVWVKFDPAKTTVDKLVQRLKSKNSFYAIKKKGTPRFIASKHSLRTQKKALYYLDLTERQAIALNSWAYYGGAMPAVLTAEQQKRYQQIRKTMGKKSLRGLKPQRTGDGLSRYRAQLAAWLAD